MVPDLDARALALRAEQLCIAGRAAECGWFAMQALEFDPDDVLALKIAGVAACMQGDYPAGLVYLERAEALAPSDKDVHFNLAVALERTGCPERAALSYRNCLRLQPDHADALWNYSEFLRLNEHFELASQCLEALEQAGRFYTGLHHRMGVVYTHLRRYDDARRHFELAMEDAADTRLTRWERSHFLLATGDFEQGWRDYDTRFDIGHVINVHCHPFPFPLWRGEALDGRTLLIHGEQGLGDEMMFASTIPELMLQGGRIVLACAPSLVTVFRHAFPAAIVRAHRVGAAPAWIGDLGTIDWQIPIGSLPRRLRSTTDSFGTGGPYLKADPDKVAWFGARLDALSRSPSRDDGLKVGVMWGSNPAAAVPFAARRATRKSIPLPLLAPLAELQNVRYVSLQNVELGEQAATVPDLDLIDFSRALKDFSDTAALVANLDAVVTVDTSVAHLSAALGKPTYVLLMRHCDWRFGYEGDRCVWYPSMTLLRQTTQGDWRPVVDQAIDALKRHPRRTKSGETSRESGYAVE
ncbi:glycosyltransferase family 9 protein [Burkholderia ubonensis]|uniref:tetratricopeptide repeat-containing glycosyltransferase family protein n=1 Tax=Burkholderia ubonensis TaxID=101571 RepID=UPI00358DEF11